MASETGGRADKLGNEFERLWAVRHLLELLAGRATSVHLEAIGDDERGTEFWVGRSNGTREAHQCKRENGARGDWSVASLEAKGIITNAYAQLKRDPSHHFFFVSGDKVTHLKDLAERSRRSDNAAEFTSDGVLSSKELRREFKTLCHCLGLNADNPTDLDLERVGDFLRRFHCLVVDKEGLPGEVETLAHYSTDGDPKAAVALLKDLADQSIGRKLRPADVIGWLPAHLAKLAARGVAHLPLRLDRDKPGNSPQQYGKDLDLPASPAACLAAEADGGAGVLILDQLDAVRWTAAHSSHTWDTVERLVADTLQEPGLRVVVVCRSFDVQDDKRIKAWKDRQKVTEVVVGPLDDGTVDRVIEAAGVSPSALDAKQRQVLRSPQGLYLWRSLRDSRVPPPAFRTMTDLMRAFWRHVRGERLPGLPAGQYAAALDALVRYMDERGTLVAPRTVASSWENEVRALLSLDVLTEERPGRLLFSHQSYLDYLTAERVVLDVHTGTGSVVGWLLRDDQTLFRRGQLRQLLALLRDDDPVEYATALRSILIADGVRFHLRHLALELLGQADPPTEAEIALASDLAAEDRWLGHLIPVLMGNVAWFDALRHNGTLHAWLNGADEGRVNYALALVERVVEPRGTEVASVLLDGMACGDQAKRLEMVLYRTSPEKLTPRLFRAYLWLARRAPNGARHVNWKQLADAHPKRFVRALAAYLRRHQRLRRGNVVTERDAFDDKSLLFGETLDAARQAVAVVPAMAWDRMMPHLLRAVHEGRVKYSTQRGAVISSWTTPYPTAEVTPRRHSSNSPTDRVKYRLNYAVLGLTGDRGTTASCGSAGSGDCGGAVPNP